MVPASHGSIGWSEHGPRVGHIRGKPTDCWHPINHERKVYWREGRELTFIEHLLWARNWVAWYIYSWFHVYPDGNSTRSELSSPFLKVGKLTFRDMLRSQIAKWKNSVKSKFCLVPGLFTFKSQKIRAMQWQRHKRESKRERESEREQRGGKRPRDTDEQTDTKTGIRNTER